VARVSLILIALSAALTAGEKETRPVINTAFLVIDGVYNSELIAPLDILQHSIYRDAPLYFHTFLVSPDGKAVRTAENLTIEVDHGFDDCPEIDVLIIPSTVTSMKEDLANEAYMTFVRERVARAAAVITLCDGAFPLAHTGVLDGKNATTFPGDQKALADRYPEIEVHRDVWWVRQDKFITSVGGAKSYEPALYLAHLWFGEAYAARLARGLVIDWSLDTMPHKTFGTPPKRPAGRPASASRP